VVGQAQDSSSDKPCFSGDGTVVAFDSCSSDLVDSDTNAWFDILVRDATAGAPLETFNSPYWRSLATPSGGLVATPAGALALVRAFRGQPAGFLRPATLAAAVRDQTGGLGGGIIVCSLEWPACP